MVDPLILSRLFHWALFVVVATLSLLVGTLPLDVGAANWPGPQMMLIMAIAWVVRRPDFVPIWLLAPIALAADFLLMRPPGLWAALTVLAVEFLRSRAVAAREWPMALEWGIAASLMTLMALSNRIFLGIFAVPQTPLGLDVQQLISSAIAYPIVLFVSVRLFGVRRPLTTEARLP